ncbi:general odorant-binding protein 56d-like [Eurosta solidaginis]|uniref:general odorant-binding protein 56d-like n=1 Tax=Eurosta solidaginis TaxID=178769 RepID=UPI0035308796
MKFVATFVLLAVLAVVATDEIKLSADQKAKADAVVKECVKETGANPDILDAAFHGDFSKIGNKEKCFTKCAQNKLGFVSKGVVKSDVIQKQLGPLAGDDKVKAVQAKCNGIMTKDDCDTSYELHRCYFNEHTSLSG